MMKKVLGKRPRPGSESDAGRFEAIFSAGYPRVLAYALRRAENRDLAEEVVSETFLIAWRRIDSVPPEPVPWLLGTARKVLANSRRSARRRAPDGPLVPLELVEVGDPRTPFPDLVADRAAFSEAFAALNRRDREVLALIAWDGLEPSEAAQVMGCTAATFSLRLHRARRRLLKELSASGHSLGERNDRAHRRSGPETAAAP